MSLAEFPLHFGGRGAATADLVPDCTVGVQPFTEGQRVRLGDTVSVRILMDGGIGPVEDFILTYPRADLTGEMSPDSPIGQAILGRYVGESVGFALPECSRVGRVEIVACHA